MVKVFLFIKYLFYNILYSFQNRGIILGPAGSKAGAPDDRGQTQS